MAVQANPVHRAVVEHLVRQAVYQRMGKPVPSTGNAPSPLVVNISARHCHLTQEAVAALFGRGHQSTPMTWLYQAGQFAAEEVLPLVGRRSRVISTLQILGPCLTLKRVGVGYRGAVADGAERRLRIDGKIGGRRGGMLRGREGGCEMPEVIRRGVGHGNMKPEGVAEYGVAAGDRMKLKMGGSCAVTFDEMLVRVDESFKFEVHIDTDEGNAVDLKPDTPCELVK